MLNGMSRGRKNLVTAELQGFADYGEVPEPYEEHTHILRSFEGEMVRKCQKMDIIDVTYRGYSVKKCVIQMIIFKSLFASKTQR